MAFFLASLVITAILLNIFIAHTISDLFLQPRAWANTKHGSLVSLTKHVALYTLLSFLLSLPSAYFLGFPLLAAYWLVNGIIHWPIDFVSSRMNWKAWTNYLSATNDKPKHLLKAILWICLDQIAHAFSLIASFIIMLGLVFLLFA